LSSEIEKTGVKKACFHERTVLKISSAIAEDRVNEVHEVIKCVEKFLENETNLFSNEWISQFGSKSLRD